MKKPFEIVPNRYVCPLKSSMLNSFKGLEIASDDFPDSEDFLHIFKVSESLVRIYTREWMHYQPGVA